MNLEDKRELEDLNERFARGDIDETDYRRRWSQITGLSCPASSSGDAGAGTAEVAGDEAPRLDPEVFPKRDVNAVYSADVESREHALAVLNAEYKNGTVDQATYEERWSAITGLTVAFHDYDTNTAPPEPVIERISRVAEPVLHTHEIRVNVAEHDASTPPQVQPNDPHRSTTVPDLATLSSSTAPVADLPHTLGHGHGHALSAPFAQHTSMGVAGHSHVHAPLLGSHHHHAVPGEVPAGFGPPLGTGALGAQGWGI
eukprot:TRINITY_DN13376_c0_g1_i1.p1 TRINITY_DN13376_c0_g1~~TRINITY_DN13376_c0_g1_i1.p1  ORF type:complete len:281 (+),score=21.19 TRINITY_DN13376_c0_g1_i1:74-844(+)